MLRLKAARAVFHTKPEKAAEYYLANVAAERRLSEWNLAKSVFSAMLPSPNRDAKQASSPMPLVAVLKNNRIFAGQALLNAGRPKDAARQFAAAENFANRLPAGGTAYLEFELEPQYVPFRVSSMPIYVKLLNAASLVQQGMKDRAMMELQQVRYYLANRTQEQRAMQDDPIPGLYAAPRAGRGPAVIRNRLRRSTRIARWKLTTRRRVIPSKSRRGRRGGRASRGRLRATASRPSSDCEPSPSKDPLVRPQPLDGFTSHLAQRTPGDDPLSGLATAPGFMSTASRPAFRALRVVPIRGIAATPQ